MATRLIRVLIVDDHEPWRRFIWSTLQRQPNLQIIGEVADGLEAVQKAEELGPDLIVLDIGLPSLNGIEVLRRLHKLSLSVKVLVVSGIRDADVVRAAFRDGARGYVLKTDARGELLSAIEAILRGQKFSSSGLRRRDSSDAEET